MTILNDKQIKQKVTRLAFEIIEQNAHERKVYLAGINNNGFAFARILLDEINAITNVHPKFELFRLTLNPASPVDSKISLDIDEKLLYNQNVIVIDDVANTGRTLFYAFKPFMQLLLKKIQVAVLVDRQHKSFPIHVNYVGLSLATTVESHIDVDLKVKNDWFVNLN